MKGWKKSLFFCFHLFLIININYFRPDIHLIDDERPDLELGEVRLRPDLEQILADEQWVDDATGLAPHCLAVLKICHNLTERLTAITMGPLQSERSSYEIVEVNDKKSK